MTSKICRFQKIFKDKNTDLLLLFSIIFPCFTKYVSETLTFCGNIPKRSYKRPYNTKFVKKYGIDRVHTPVVEDINKDTE